jgi:hypothetical protein
MTLNTFIIVSNIVFYWLAFLVSIWIGNFITSFYYRIPRGITLNGIQNPPMCSNCGIRLKYPDYGPLYYYLFKAKHCKSCGVHIPAMYFYIELFIGLVLVCNFIINGISEASVVNCFFIASIFLILFINIKHKQVFEKSLVFLIIFALIKGFYLHGTEEFLYEVALSLMCGGLLSKALIKQGSPIGYRQFFYILPIGFEKLDAVLIFLASYAISLAYKKSNIVTNACVISITWLLCFDSFHLIKIVKLIY